MVRKGIKLLLTENYPGIHIEEASDGQELINKVAKEKWDIIISDISMPGRSGVEVIKDIKQLAPRTPILILSTHAAEQYAIRIIRAGVWCYLTKESAPDELINAIESLLKGKRYLTDEVIDLLASSIVDTENIKLHNKLTDKEFEVMQHLVHGKTVSEISNSFSVSKNTISAYKSKIFEKMQMTTTADLIRYSMENQL